MHLLYFLLCPLPALAIPPLSRTAHEAIALLNLQPNIEKGYYRETFADAELVKGNRSASTAIYYLLEGRVGHSEWHRLNAAEVWYVDSSDVVFASPALLFWLCAVDLYGTDTSARHHYAGAPLTLEMLWDDGTVTESVLLGNDIFDGQVPQAVVSALRWQRARSEGEWTLVGTTVAPGFVESGFELRRDWMPDDGR